MCLFLWLFLSSFLPISTHIIQLKLKLFIANTVCEEWPHCSSESWCLQVLHVSVFPCPGRAEHGYRGSGQDTHSALSWSEHLALNAVTGSSRPTHSCLLRPEWPWPFGPFTHTQAQACCYACPSPLYPRGTKARPLVYSSFLSLLLP